MEGFYVQVTSIDEVIQRLDEIIHWASNERNRLGYFAALYRKVTIRVKEGIEDGFFEDGERMERLDVVFANRYFEAFDQYQNGRVPTRSWRVAFDNSKHWWPIVLQHLLLGMNAHINVDLGIAAARTSPGDTVHELKNDFDKINDILASLVDGVERELAHIWPMLKLLDRILGRSEEVLINFSMRKARDHAWNVALQFAPLAAHKWSSKLDGLDKEIAALGRKIRYPGLIIGLKVKLIRLGELGTISQIIDILK